MANFNLAVERLLKHEGGYSFNSRDKGGETKFGISKRSYPDLEIDKITVEDAKAIYKKDYWNKVWGDKITSQKVAEMVFDVAVNSGPKKAIQLLQESINIHRSADHLVVDGIMGPKTLTATNSVLNIELLVREIARKRLILYTNIVKSDPSQITFLQGWINRVMDYV